MVLIVGGGPAGLAAAAALKAVGIEARVLERASEVGASWTAHYDRLHLHTVRWLSGLPGLPLPRAYGRWVARDDVVRYLKDYAAHHALDVRLGVEVRRIDRGLRVETSDGEMHAERVIVASGYNRIPYLPNWPGAFRGELLHASRYKNGSRYRDRHVLVVGGGNTGAEIAVDLVEHGAARVELSLRTPPNIVPRSAIGVPTQVLAILLHGMPPSIVDTIARGMSRSLLGDLSTYGVARSERGTFTRAIEDGQVPILDVGLVEHLRAGNIHVVGAMERFEDADVILANGARTRPDAIVAATGYRRGLEPLVLHLGVLDERGAPLVHGAATHPRVPGLHFIGYTNPITGNLRAIANDARAIARALSRN